MNVKNEGVVDLAVRSLRRDLSAFADSGVPVDLTVSGRKIEGSWETFGEARRAQFSVDASGAISYESPFGPQPYRVFLASDAMADLRRMARAVGRLRSPNPYYVDSRAKWGDEEGAAVDVIRTAVGDPSAVDSTRIVFLTAEAGVGKTSALRELVVEQAKAYELNQSPFIFLYIDAQGRALARFNEALALELDDLGAPIRYHAVSALVRHGLVVPVVDGFDELVGSKGGYEDAFSSLTDFVQGLHGVGALVASARSVYYEQEFVRRAESVGGELSYWQQEPIRIQPWRKEEFDAFVEKRIVGEHVAATERARAKNIINGIFSGENQRLREKPLFVSQALNLVLEGRGRSLLDAGDLLGQVVDIFVEREVNEKLRYARGGSILTKEQLIQLLNMFAEEMWNVGSRELNARTVQEVAEFFGEVAELPIQGLDILKERASVLAFLVPGSKRGTVAFEHEIFFSWFLAISVATSLREEAASLRMLLGRYPLPQEAGRAAAARLRDGKDAIQKVLDSLERVSRTDSPLQPQITENAGVIASSVLKRQGNASSALRGLRLSSLVFAGVDLHDLHLSNCVLKDVTFRGTDLTRTRFHGCHGDGVRFESPLLSRKTTLLDISNVDPYRDFAGAQVVDPDGTEVLFDPHSIQRLLHDVGVPFEVEESVEPAVEPEILRVLNLLMRSFSRANPVCLDDQELHAVVSSPIWPELERALIGSGVAVRESRQTRGRPRRWLRRRFLPEQLMKGVGDAAAAPPEVRAFWRQLEESLPPERE